MIPVKRMIEDRAYRLILVVGGLLACQRIAMEIQEHRMVIDQQLSLKRGLLVMVKRDRLNAR